MLYKFMNNLVDCQPLTGTLRLNPRQSRGQAQKLTQLPARIDAYQHSFFPAAIRLWNSLPPAAFSTGSPEAFKSIVEG